MTDRDWDALLDSPYDDRRVPSQPRGSKGPQKILVLVAAAVVGVTAGWVAAGLLGDVDPTAAPTTTSTAVAAPIPTTGVSDDGFLFGFTPTGATALGGVGSFQASGMTYVVVAEIVGVGADRTAVPRVTVGEWELETDEGIVPMTREIRAALSPGVGLIEFDTTASATGLRFYGAGEVFAASSCTRCEVPVEDTSDGDLNLGEVELPAVVDDGVLSLELDDDLTVLVEYIGLAENWGFVQWTTESTDSGKVAVDFFVTYVGSAEPGTEFNTSMAPEHELPPRFGRGQSSLPAEPAAAGDSNLARFGPPVAPETDSVSLILRWQARWLYPAGEPIVIPIP